MILEKATCTTTAATADGTLMIAYMERERTAEIALAHNDLQSAKTPVDLAAAVPAAAVRGAGR